MSVPYRLFNRDCLTILPTIPAGIVDMVMVDLPYGVTAAKWDAIIPFEPMWAELNRLVKPTGAMVFTATQPFTSKLVCSNLSGFRYDWAWEKSKLSGMLNSARRPMRNKEDILVFSQDTCVYFPQIQQDPTNKRRARPGTGRNTIHGSNFTKLAANPGIRQPTQILRFASVGKHQHPTQKPIGLLKYLISTYTQSGETVLDFTMGSGSTGVACMALRRRFIGIEIDTVEGYFTTATNRIESAYQKSLSSFFPI